MIDCSQMLGLHVFRVCGNVGERMYEHGRWEAGMELYAYAVMEGCDVCM